MGAAVAAIEYQRLLIVLHRRPQLAQPTVGVADVVLNIGVVRIAHRGELERSDRPVQSSATSAFLPAAKSGSSSVQSASDPIAAMVVQIGQSSVASFVSGARSDAPGQTANMVRQPGWLAM